MGVDWITVAAQVVNFLILIWLLKRFLYRPVLDGIDRREARIAARLAEAEAARKAAAEAEAEHRAASAAMAAERSAILDAARERAQTDCEALRADARMKVDDERADWHRRADAERGAYLDRLRDVGAGAVLSLTRKAVEDLADATLEDLIVAQVEQRLADLGPQIAADAGGDARAVATSSFPLDPARRESLRRALDAVAEGVSLDFATDPDAAPGLTLRMGGTCIGWTVDAYFDDLEERLETRLRAASAMQGAAS